MKKITIFSQKVYQLCSQIPPGQVSTYKCLARFLRSSPRAVGQALAKNPLAPQVPCHRVIATNFALGGYKGEKKNSAIALDKKELLQKEGVFFDEEGYLLKNLRKKVIFCDFQ
jgi:methylated-DNA-[protein]-cysteine S-methyltransferase